MKRFVARLFLPVIIKWGEHWDNKSFEVEHWHLKNILK